MARVPTATRGWRVALARAATPGWTRGWRVVLARAATPGWTRGWRVALAREATPGRAGTPASIRGRTITATTGTRRSWTYE